MVNHSYSDEAGCSLLTDKVVHACKCDLHKKKVFPCIKGPFTLKIWSWPKPQLDDYQYLKVVFEGVILLVCLWEILLKLPLWETFSAICDYKPLSYTYHPSCSSPKIHNNQTSAKKALAQTALWNNVWRFHYPCWSYKDGALVFEGDNVLGKSTLGQRR